MHWYRWHSLSLIAALLFALGCGAPAEHKSRPRAGDCITPLVRDAGPWISGKVARFAVQVKVDNAEGSNAALLTNDDVPEEVLPDLKVTFFRGEELLHVEQQPSLERFC